MCAALKVGDQLPAFELPTDTPGVTVSSKEMVSQSGAILFVYPAAATSGCTVQAQGFRDNYTTFEEKGYKVYGISADPPSAQAAWKKEHNFGYPLLSDESLQVLQQLGSSPDGKTITRSHIIIEKGGKISDLTIGVSSKESVPKALATVNAAQ